MERIAARLEAADYQRSSSRGGARGLALGVAAVAVVCIVAWGVVVLWSSGSEDTGGAGELLDGRLTLVGGRVFGTLEAVASALLVAPEADVADSGVLAGDAAHRGAPSNSRSWVTLARQGEFNEAFSLLGAEGLERETRSAPSVGELYLLADVARRSGHPDDAVAPLERIIAGFPTDRRAAVAAFTLGRIQLNTLGEPARARWAFERAIELGVPPALTEDSLALLVEARARSGDSLGARAAARDYLRRYPEGRLADTVRSWTELGDR